MNSDKFNSFSDLGYEAFRSRATDARLSPNEKIGFPDSYRAGKTGAILADITCKLTNLLDRDKAVLDIGPGCSELAVEIMTLCASRKHQLHLVDSEEMLSQLPNQSDVIKHCGRFPADLADDHMAGKFDAIVVYSVLQYVYVEQSVFAFLDQVLRLLASGGQLLLGDIPNVSKRKRFFSSDAGAAFHREFTNSTTSPDVQWNTVENGQIDDAVIFSVVARARLQGFDAYIVPQSPALPMANRREDILIVKP